MKSLPIFFSLVILIFVSSSCKKQDDSQESVIQENVQQTKASTLEIIDPWVRPSAAGTNTAFFFKIVNNTGHDDTLYAAASDLAQKVEVHETYMAENNMMGMRHVEFVLIPAGDTVVFKPRDLHVMLMKLNKDLIVDDSGDVILVFKNAGEVRNRAVVRDMPK